MSDLHRKGAKLLHLIALANAAKARGNWLTASPMRLLLMISAMALAVPIAAQSQDADDQREDGQRNGADALRRYIDQQVGGIAKLRVPALDAGLPGAQLPDGSDASNNPRYVTTEAKRYLGKQLFHDPVRTARIRPEFGGVLQTAQTGSCGSCHQGESASKAGTLINFNVGGEGRGYTDALGNFVPRRRARTDLLPSLRNAPLFEGDALVDALPTLTDVYQDAGPASPARGRKQPPPGALLATGRLDALDSVARNAPSILGAAFNNRLLYGGFAGEPDASPGGLNPFNDPAQESVALLLLDAHRMLESQSAVIQTFPAYRKLFREAFPAEASEADASGDLNLLINDQTIFRATATFMRTVVTRDAPWDRFLAGDNRALTPAQRRGARLFFTPALNGAGGAGCFSCHSGPQLNKQPNDPDILGAGKFVEENFFNLGLDDHPVQALNRQARRDPKFLDDGRREVTGRQDDAFKFRVTTLRQTRDARFFFHNGAFTSVRAVVEYFNNGVPQNAQAGRSPTLTSRFTNPRGPGFPAGLGLTRRQMDDLTDFIENALYDEAFVRYNPRSPTRTFQLSRPDFRYSLYRPDLAALGAIDGLPISGLAQDNNDPLSRRDQGLEFLDVGKRASVILVGRNRNGGHQRDVYRISNTSAFPIDTHLILIARGLSRQIVLANASGLTRTGDPYRRLFLDSGVIMPGQTITAALEFRLERNDSQIRYSVGLLSGQGNP
jgi:cytochrome c peroxidase